MRFKASIRNINTFTTSLHEYSPTQPLIIQDAIFETYTIQSAAPANTINLRIPLAHLHRALRSALAASAASLRLTKIDNIPLLSLTITANPLPSSRAPAIPTSYSRDLAPADDGQPSDDFASPSARASDPGYLPPPPDRDTTITQNIPVEVLAPATVAQIHEPKCREADVHIMLPPLLQLKAISERFTKLAEGGSSRLLLKANGHGKLGVGVETASLRIESLWEGLVNPELDPGQVEGGEEGVRGHASTRMREGGGWACVRVEGRDWGRVLGVGRMGGRVIACEFSVWEVGSGKGEDADTGGSRFLP
ncbi:MAG: hypothetical protein Q9195_005750 [Heterodermia aff. obscurata]